MPSTAQKIEKEIKRKRRGKIYFADDFVALGTPEAVKKTLLRLQKSGFLVRVARGIYLYPTVDRKMDLRIIYPTIDDIAKEIARRDKSRIVPTGVYALQILGLVSQVPINIIYHTDGASRKIRVYNQYIYFKHVAPKKIAYKSSTLMLIVSAMKEIGNDNITKEQIEKIKRVLSNTEKEKMLYDINLAPEWIRKVLLQSITNVCGTLI